ncbi:uncharacterized protein LOC135129480 [Zophobas morio]|uniref:uncharacterized protein LOC135129480 n=1 Tax=Zophobas morio TaxID=2755281 RepID=UPI003083411D
MPLTKFDSSKGSCPVAIPGYICISACKGDSGGGLVSKFRKRYYIVGVVSISPHATEGSCDSQQYTLYPRFGYYIEKFILEKEARFRPRVDCPDVLNCNNDTSVTTPQPTTEKVTTESSSSYCILPNHPEFGKWIVVGASDELQPGIAVASDTVCTL